MGSRTVIIQKRIEQVTLYLKRVGPSDATTIRKALKLTKGQTNYVLFKTNQFKRTGVNDCYWTV